MRSKNPKAPTAKREEEEAEEDLGAIKPSIFGKSRFDEIEFCVLKFSGRSPRLIFQVVGQSRDDVPAGSRREAIIPARSRLLVG
jgi:hypothetical protein